MCPTLLSWYAKIDSVNFNLSKFTIKTLNFYFSSKNGRLQHSMLSNYKLESPQDTHLQERYLLWPYITAVTPLEKPQRFNSVIQVLLENKPLILVPSPLNTLINSCVPCTQSLISSQFCIIAALLSPSYF